MHVVDLICDILYFTYATEYMHLPKITHDHPLVRVCQLCYRILLHTVQDYMLNEFYVAQWIDLFFNQAMQTDEGCDLKVEKMLTVLLKTNKLLLDKQITKDNIAQVIDLCMYRYFYR